MRLSLPFRVHNRPLSGLRHYEKPLRKLAKPRYKGSVLCQPQKVIIEDAVRVVKAGDWVYLHHAASTPVDLLNALGKHVKKHDVRNVTTTSALLMGDIPFARDPEIYDYIRPKAIFISPAIRKAVNQGKADYIPLFLNESGRIFDDKRLPVDVAFLNLSPPDENGYCSLGVNCDMSSPAARNAKLIVASINESQPLTFGDSKIHVSHIDYLVSETETPISGVPKAVIKPEEEEIGRLIAENLVEDEATLQLGIGSIPDAVLSKLTHHKNLGLHTEMVSDGIISLMRNGNVNNSKKTLHPGKGVLAFAMGSKHFYDFIDGNEDFVFGSVGYTNDVDVIASNHRMTGINSAIEIDLTGQVVSDSIGTSIFSGFGGQVDFVYGSANGKDGRGKSIIAITSRTEKGHSKIVPIIKEGAGVVSTRAHVRYLVTEYGIADLWARSNLHRAYELIRVAHPGDREHLEKAAFKRFGALPRRDL
ncbi:unnamed protein product [Bursaphelenchus xylophilus]|uniref:(pine wood nematode) hypothetical protein n=1 Tax=Bursaphelenchus xylophilus TaxID=6326 RepID=A0A1I7RS55_BURXY|nr:unnamed protein product [Bursaphelenchus xylophilus]CAG9123199.1 unnamed protein product [Bursaphelenchus xylophilus]